MGDRYGAKKSTIAMFVIFLALSAAMLGSITAWQEPSTFTAFVYGWVVLDILITVVALPISMRLCDPRVAATQFTLYMALTNFGISIAAWVLSFSDQLGGLPTMFALVFALHVTGLVLMLVVRFPRRTPSEELVARELVEGKGPPPVRN